MSELDEMVKTLLNDFLGYARFRDIIADESLSTGDRLVAFLNTVDLEALRLDLKERNEKQGYKFSLTDAFTMHCIEAFRPDLFEEPEQADLFKKPIGDTKTDAHAVAAYSYSDLKKQTAELVESGEINDIESAQLLKAGRRAFKDIKRNETIN